MVNVRKEVAEENRRELAISADVLSRRHGLERVGVAEIAEHAKWCKTTTHICNALAFAFGSNTQAEGNLHLKRLVSATSFWLDGFRLPSDVNAAEGARFRQPRRSTCHG